MIILVDTREQKPFWHRSPNGMRLQHACLKVGDYTTATLLNKFHIERKSLCDLYSTLIHSHPRFRREILRAGASRCRLVVVVEGSYSDFINKNFRKGEERKATTAVLRKIIATVRRRYGLEIIFCKNRECARKMALKRLIKEERKMIRKK
jgi:ERCC4-type nuclease